MRLAIIVVNYNAARFLGDCLRSVETAMHGISHQVVVVDNASADGSIALLRDFPYVNLIRNSSNLGFAAALNRGLAASTSEYVLWLNPDAEILGGFGDLLHFLDGNPDVAIVGPKILDPSGSIQLSCRSFPSYTTAFANRYSPLTLLFPRNRLSRRYLNSDWDHDSIRETDWVSGACLVHRRDLTASIGVVDERYFMYCEDVDFCYRAKKVGKKVVFHPGAVVRHRIGGSSRHHPIRMNVEHHRSMWRYYAKHFRRNPVKDTVVYAGIVMHCLASIPGKVQFRSDIRD